MKSLVLATVLCFGVSAVAADAQPDWAAINKNMECNMKQNQAAMDMYAGMDPDGAAFVFGGDGKTQVLDSGRVISRATNGDTETITYKTKELRYDSTGKTMYETVKRTVQVKREGGKIVSVSKLYDVAQQAADQASFAKACKDCQNFGKWPLMKSAETTFAYDGKNGCAINQNVVLQMKDEKASPEAKVTFDKKFCDSLGPVMKQMGSQNAAQCGNLLSMAEGYFSQRSGELKKEGKSFYDYSFPGADQKNKSPFSNSNISMQIAMCASAENPVMTGGMGVYPGGTGLMMGGGFVIGGGAMGMPAAKPSSNKGTSNSAVQ
ncbi:hypothetical protein [Bdellovibrio sp. NC01]|uniref:hypothetical protein n=1 Tax=Bdellovibrio sp. NC01 TaxID=2220073 RepID=UPI00115A9FFA|nr:hypothetical protein [Bdellovibrio sp. NC01]QDK36286.1 hypothetical protein DOE51_01065 [Bdellovibrio sp. NC01]